MSYCKYCHRMIPDDAKDCPYCEGTGRRSFFDYDKAVGGQKNAEKAEEPAAPKKTKTEEEPKDAETEKRIEEPKPKKSEKATESSTESDAPEKQSAQAKKTADTAAAAEKVNKAAEKSKKKTKKVKFDFDTVVKESDGIFSELELIEPPKKTDKAAEKSSKAAPKSGDKSAEKTAGKKGGKKPLKERLSDEMTAFFEVKKPRSEAAAPKKKTAPRTVKRVAQEKEKEPPKSEPITEIQQDTREITAEPKEPFVPKEQGGGFNGELEKEILKNTVYADGEQEEPRYNKYIISLVAVLVLCLFGLGIFALSGKSTDKNAENDALMLDYLCGEWLSGEYSYVEDAETYYCELLEIREDATFSIKYLIVDNSDPFGYLDGAWAVSSEMEGIVAFKSEDSSLNLMDYDGVRNYEYIRYLINTSDDGMTLREYYDKQKTDYYDVEFSRVERPAEQTDTAEQ